MVVGGNAMFLLTCNRKMILVPLQRDENQELHNHTKMVIFLIGCNDITVLHLPMPCIFKTSGSSYTYFFKIYFFHSTELFFVDFPFGPYLDCKTFGCVLNSWKDDFLITKGT